VHHGTPAGRVHRRSRSAGKAEIDKERLVARRVRRSEQTERRRQQARGQNDALAEAIGGQAPREERDRGADPPGREQQPDLAQREVVLFA
jgi:hypothetical protein